MLCLMDNIIVFENKNNGNKVMEETKNAASME